MSILALLVLIAIFGAVILRINSRTDGLLKREKWSLAWRRATANDWPPVKSLGYDHNWARKTGTGFVAEHGDELLYLIDRDWFGFPDPPQWGLASFNQKTRKWRLWGNFDDLPMGWKVPEPLYA